MSSGALPWITRRSDNRNACIRTRAGAVDVTACQSVPFNAFADPSEPPLVAVLGADG